MQSKMNNRSPYPRGLIALCFIALCFLSFSIPAVDRPAFAQEISYEDRIGSNRDFDVCEDFRFKQISKLVEQGTLSRKQGFNIWMRLESNKDAVKTVFNEAVEAGELTEEQTQRLLPLLDMDMTYMDTQHGKFGVPKELTDGKFKEGEVTSLNRKAVYERLVAANKRGDIYDYDVASIMKQLYAGFDEAKASVDEVTEYRSALNPRIAQSGSEARIRQSVQRGRGGSSGDSYGRGEVKITDPASWTKSLEKPIYSGPQLGEKALPLTVYDLRGKEAGKEYDPVTRAGDKLHLMFFVRESRTFGRFLGQLTGQIQAIEDHSKQPWAVSVVVCTDDANTAEKEFAILDQRYPPKLAVGVSVDGAAGPPAYGLDKNVTATVIVVKQSKVTHNFVYSSNEFYNQPHILGAIAEVMEVDHATLRKYIGETPGDAAAAAAIRNRRGNPGAAEQELRNRLTPLVLNGRLTRFDAGQLLKASGDEAALRAMIDQWLKMEKLTLEEARSLSAPLPKKTDNKPAKR